MIEINLNDLDVNHGFGKALVDAVLAGFSLEFRDTLADGIEREARRAAREIVESTAVSMTKVLLEPHIREVMEKGWSETDSYGNRTGRVVSLSERIGRVIESGDGGYNGRKWMESAIKEEIQKVLSGELKGPIDEARAKIRALFDDTVARAFSNAVRAGFGLKEDR